MRKANEILHDYYNVDNARVSIIDAVRAIELAQKEAFNEALDKVLVHGQVKRKTKLSESGRWIESHIIDEQSILNLKLK